MGRDVREAAHLAGPQVWVCLQRLCRDLTPSPFTGCVSRLHYSPRCCLVPTWVVSAVGEVTSFNHEHDDQMLGAPSVLKSCPGFPVERQPGALGAHGWAPEDQERVRLLAGRSLLRGK